MVLEMAHIFYLYKKLKQTQELRMIESDKET